MDQHVCPNSQQLQKHPPPGICTRFIWTGHPTMRQTIALIFTSACSSPLPAVLRFLCRCQVSIASVPPADDVECKNGIIGFCFIYVKNYCVREGWLSKIFSSSKAVWSDFGKVSQFTVGSRAFANSSWFCEQWAVSMPRRQLTCVTVHVWRWLKPNQNLVHTMSCHCVLIPLAAVPPFLHWSRVLENSPDPICVHCIALTLCIRVRGGEEIDCR